MISNNPKTVIEYPLPVTRGRPRTVTSPTAPIKKSKKRVANTTEEYRDHRDRNNVAVRKSRTKSKSKQNETEERVHDLQAQNIALQTKVDLLSKELQVLKSLFTNVAVPDSLNPQRPV